MVNRTSKEVVIYEFREKNISRRQTYRQAELAKSFVFEELTVELARVFG
ncbi:MAG: hypothetical protein GX058_01765 [Firmicutes bacterium]|nr:hypothetical protein [Bacillota bacterium]